MGHRGIRCDETNHAENVMTTPHETQTANHCHGEHEHIVIFINGQPYTLATPHQTGRSLKELAGISLDATLFLDHPGEDEVIANDTKITLKNDAKLHSQPPANYGHADHVHPHPPDRRVSIRIDGKDYHVEPEQTGYSLKVLAGLPLDSVLFLKRPIEDLVVTNETKVCLTNGDELCAQVPANYGLGSLPPGHRPQVCFTEHPQPDGWLFVVLHDVSIPAEYQPSAVKILIKLPPLFPDAAPDMFWVSPAVKLANGTSPRSTSPESALGQTWQRFSWHLLPGAWRSGISSFQDYLRCVRGRFEKKD
jgi:hypothetical protein